MNSSHDSKSFGVTEDQVRNFLKDELLSHQRISLPFGLSTPGSDRRRVEAIAFPESLQGKSVLDIGSHLGAFCIEALRRGAKSAVGIELDRERLRQAALIARMVSWNPTYIRGDVEELSIDEDFDIVLALNILSELRNPLAVLRKIALRARVGLIVESTKVDVQQIGESVGTRVGQTSNRIRRRILKNRHIHSLRKYSPGNALACRVLNHYPSSYVAAYDPRASGTTHLYSRHALSSILRDHMKLFWRVEAFESDTTARFLLRCTRMRFQRLIVVAGACASGKSTLIARLLDNEFVDELGVVEPGSTVATRLPTVWTHSLDDIFPTPTEDTAVLQWDISSVDGFGMHGFGRDPASDLLRCASRVEVIIVVPRQESLIRQLKQSEFIDRTPQPRHKMYSRWYERASYLEALYCDWIDFCEQIAPKASYWSVESTSDAERLSALSGAKSARTAVRRIYAT